MANYIEQLNTGLSRVKGRLQKFPIIQLILQTAEGSGKHDIGQMAAAVAYYAFLSIFPLLLVLVAVLGFVLPSINVQDQLLKFVGDNIPGATSILQKNIDNIIHLRGAVGVVSIVILLWGASVMFGAISLAINRAWGIRRYHRNFFIRKAAELGMTFGIGLLFLLSLGASALFAILRGVFNLPAADLIIVNAGSRIVAFLLMVAVFLLLYKLIPNTRTSWRDIWPGALLGAALFEIARTLFIYYIENFANYQLLYGSIASIIILLVWIYYSAFVLILGAEFTYQLGRIRHPVKTGNGVDK